MSPELLIGKICSIFKYFLSYWVLLPSHGPFMLSGKDYSYTLLNRVCLCINATLKLSYTYSKFAGIAQRKTHSHPLIYYSCSSRQRLTAFQGLFFFPPGSMWWMMDNFPALRQSSHTTPPSWLFLSSTLSWTNKRTSFQLGLGLVKLSQLNIHFWYSNF